MNKEYQAIVENYFKDSVFDMIAPSMGKVSFGIAAGFGLI